jgi:hypothetical protein
MATGNVAEASFAGDIPGPERFWRNRSSTEPTFSTIARHVHAFRDCSEGDRHDCARLSKPRLFAPLGIDNPTS